MSHSDTSKAYDPVLKSTLGAKELSVIEPGVVVFLRIETDRLFVFATTMSGFPSPSMSPIATPVGIVPVVKSTLFAKELVVIER